MLCSVPFFGLPCVYNKILSLCPALKSSGCSAPACGSLSRHALALSQTSCTCSALQPWSQFPGHCPLPITAPCVCRPPARRCLPSLSTSLETSQCLGFSLALSSECGFSPGAHQGTWRALSKRGPSGWERRFPWRGVRGPQPVLLSCLPCAYTHTHTHTLSLSFIARTHTYTHAHT